jgi:hypothetical protein
MDLSKALDNPMLPTQLLSQSMLLRLWSQSVSLPQLLSLP